MGRIEGSFSGVFGFVCILVHDATQYFGLPIEGLRFLSLILFVVLIVGSMLQRFGTSHKNKVVTISTVHFQTKK